MAAIKTVAKIFGMFDKIDDIVYEPIKLVCDALRLPLKQVDVHNEKAKAENAQRLEKELKQFEADLECQKREREINMNAEERRLAEEINQMILDNDLSRREKMIQLEAKYRKEMAAAAVELERIITNISTENRDKIFKLYAEHKKRYLDVQNAYTDSVYANVARMKELVSGEAGETRIMDFMFSYINKIMDESTNFITLLDKDAEKIIDIVDKTTKETSNLSAKYLQPALPNQSSLTQDIVEANQPALSEDSTVTTEIQ